MSDRANESQLPLEVLEAFTTSVAIAVREMTQFEAIPVDETTLTSSLLPEVMVVATMRLQRTLPGTMTLMMSANTAEQLAERYLPAGTELTTEMVNDFAGEFANVVAGQAKTTLKGTPYHFFLSLPVVTRRDNVERHAGVATNLAFESATIQLYIDLLPVAGA